MAQKHADPDPDTQRWIKEKETGPHEKMKKSGKLTVLE
jgi:hypothetical protein